MLSNFRKNKSKNIFFQFLIGSGAILILFIAVLLVVADIKIYQKKKQLDSQIENLKSKIQGLENKSDSLKEGISNVSDQEYIEKIAREELNLQRPGEKVISFVVSQKEPLQNNIDKKNFLQIWLGWLGNIFK